MKAIGYIRVSTDKQAKFGVSMEDQQEKIELYCKLNDFELVGIYKDEGISGRKTFRPEFQKAFEYVMKEKAVFIVYKLDRFGRSAIETIQLGEKLGKSGANLVSVSEHIDTTTTAGKLFFRMLAVLNEYYVDNLIDLVNGALQYRKRQNKKLGGLVPYGYNADKEGVLSINKKEQEVISKIISMENKGSGLREIARKLNDSGYRTKTGKYWHPQTVSNVLKSA